MQMVNNKILKNIEELVDLGMSQTRISELLDIDRTVTSRYVRAIKEIKTTGNLTKLSTNSISVNQLKSYFNERGITFTVNNIGNNETSNGKKDDEAENNNNKEQVEVIINGMRSIYMMIAQTNRLLKKMCSLWEVNNETEESDEDSEYIKKLYEVFGKNNEEVV